MIIKRISDTVLIVIGLLILGAVSIGLGVVCSYRIVRDFLLDYRGYGLTDGV